MDAGVKDSREDSLNMRGPCQRKKTGPLWDSPFFSLTSALFIGPAGALREAVGGFGVGFGK
jgi:hypothetical protein